MLIEKIKASPYKEVEKILKIPTFSIEFHKNEDYKLYEFHILDFGTIVHSPEIDKNKARSKLERRATDLIITTMLDSVERDQKKTEWDFKNTWKKKYRKDKDIKAFMRSYNNLIQDKNRDKLEEFIYDIPSLNFLSFDSKELKEVTKSMQQYMQDVKKILESSTIKTNELLDVIKNYLEIFNFFSFERC